SSAQPARVRAATRPRTTSRQPRGERLPEDGDRTSRPSDTTRLGHFRQDLRPSGHLTANTALVRETARRARGVTLVPTGRGGIRRWRVSVEGVAARAGAARVRVVGREALLVDGVGEVDRRAGEVGHAHPVDDDLDATEVAHGVAVEQTLVEVELVDEAGAAAGLHGDPQPQVVTALLRE